MDTITSTIKTLICEDSYWIKRMTSYPDQTTKIEPETFNKYFHNLKETFDSQPNVDEAYNKIICSYNTYEIIKVLLETQGIRAVHPVWFFIHKEKFETDGLIFNENDFLLVKLETNSTIEIKNKIQKLETLNFYYTILNNEKLYKSIIDIKSKFIMKYKLNEKLNGIKGIEKLWKYFYFPCIEEKDSRTNCYIDLAYKFDDIIDNINIEINEPGHDPETDFFRASKIYYLTGNRIIQYYINENELKNHTILSKEIIPDFFFMMTKSIYNKNKYSGLTFNSFVKDIVDNLFIAIFCSELKEEIVNKKLTFNKFVELCNKVELVITIDFINIIDTILSKRKQIRNKQLNLLFYNFKELNGETLLTRSGVNLFLMNLHLALPNSPLAFSIAMMYSNYVEEHDKLFDRIVNDNTIEHKLKDCYTKSDEYIITETAKRIMKK